MRMNRATPALTLVYLSQAALGQSWVEYRNMTDRFSVNLPAPGEPEVTEIQYPSEYGAVFPGRVYTARSGDSVFSVTVIDYTDAQEVHLARTNTTEADSRPSYEYWRIDVLASIAYMKPWRAGTMALSSTPKFAKRTGIDKRKSGCVCHRLVSIQLWRSCGRSGLSIGKP